MLSKKELLYGYIKTNVAPILIDFLSGSDFDDAVILNANIDKLELTGHYEGVEYLPPKWFNEITKGTKILVIDKIDSINKEEQLKFVEILKYRKISTFELPKELIIIVTVGNIDKNINEEILSLTARIGDENEL